MINQVIDRVLAAESQAEEIRVKADEQAQSILTESEKNCLKLTEDGISKAKSLRENILNEYSAKAESEYRKIVGEAENKSLDLKNQKKALSERIGESIYGRIINGDC